MLVFFVMFFLVLGFALYAASEKDGDYLFIGFVLAAFALIVSLPASLLVDVRTVEAQGNLTNLSVSKDADGHDVYTFDVDGKRTTVTDDRDTDLDVSATTGKGTYKYSCNRVPKWYFVNDLKECDWDIALPVNTNS